MSKSNFISKAGMASRAAKVGALAPSLEDRIRQSESVMQAHPVSETPRAIVAAPQESVVASRAPTR